MRPRKLCTTPELVAATGWPEREKAVAAVLMTEAERERVVPVGGA